MTMTLHVHIIVWLYFLELFLRRTIQKVFQSCPGDKRNSDKDVIGTGIHTNIFL